MRESGKLSNSPQVGAVERLLPLTIRWKDRHQFARNCCYFHRTMTEQVELYRNYARFVKRLVLLAGIWPMTQKESSYFYRQLPILAVSSGVIMFFGVLRFCRDNISNLSLFTKGLSLVGSFSLISLKALMFFVYRKQLSELNGILDPMFEKTLENPRLRPILLSLLNLFRYFTYIFYVLITSTLALYICTPLIFIGYEAIKDIHPRRYGLPFPTSFPWIDGTPGIYYHIEYLFEIQFGWFAIFVTSSVDSLFGFYIFQIVGLFRAISYECEYFTQSAEDLHDILHNCIKKHIKLLHCRDIIQNVYGPIVFNLVLTSATVLCALTFQIFKTEMTVSKTLLFVVYGVMKGIQTFMYAWYGSIIIFEAEDFRRRIYCCKWYAYGNLSIMKEILLVLTQKPMVLVACNFFSISLDMFLKCFIKRLMLCAGLWPVENKESSYFYRHLPIFTVLSGIFMFFGTLKFCLENLDNIKVLTKGLSPLGSFGLVAVKALMFFLYREQLRELNLNLELMFEEMLEKTHYRPVVLSLLNLFKRPAYIVYYLTMFIILLPFLLIVYQITKNISPKHYVLPYPATFSWIDGTPNILYQAQFLFEIIFGWFVVSVTSGVDTVYGFYIFQMSGILRVMCFECEKLGKSSKELDIILRNCIKRQILLLRCRDIIQNVYGPVVLCLIVSSVVVLCALIFQMFQTEISIGKTVLFLIYGTMKMTQAFMYSWYGSILAVESEAFRRSIYCCGWYQDGNIELMKDVLLMLVQKPIVLTACHLFYISLDLFVKILNTSLSYYFLLQTFDENNDES
ncbi:odorant receptor Or2-like [Vespula squamosa]|uniref:Odorant receptor Or2-like n=1 Tax=Vespula squamosa TaxID=30214 RepID=A0ABD1ZZQ5_VESSQ